MNAYTIGKQYDKVKEKTLRDLRKHYKIGQPEQVVKLKIKPGDLVIGERNEGLQIIKIEKWMIDGELIIYGGWGYTYVRKLTKK